MSGETDTYTRVRAACESAAPYINRDAHALHITAIVAMAVAVPRHTTEGAGTSLDGRSASTLAGGDST